MTADRNRSDSTTNTSCDSCGGSGQLGLFRGVSRFIISWEECPDCDGTGRKENGSSTAESTTEKKKDGID